MNKENTRMTQSFRIQLGYWIRNHKNLHHIASSINKIYYNILSPLRIEPSFLIIGAARSGTTSLYEYLIQHPLVLPAAGKEVYFFDKKFDNGINWYKSFFPFKWKKTKLKNHKAITGEATPRYLHHPHCPKRVHTFFPKMKLIVLLRNPIDRAYSHYQMEYDHGHESLSFEKSVQEEDMRIKNELEKMEKNENYYSVDFYRKSYKTRGIYVTQLQNWFTYFPREQFLIIKSEDFYNDPEKIYEQVLHFLNLPSFKLKNYKQYKMRKYSTMKAETKNFLENFFHPYNEQLSMLIGKDFEWDNDESAN